jgi:3,4-dihydroxy 2-butanone 4-phosphate synthase
MSESNHHRNGQRTADRAVAAFRNGNPVLVRDADDRESEVDLVYPAAAVAPEDVARLRNDAGGLVCVALSYETAEAFDLPLLADELSHPCAESTELPYDERSSFSLTVNHRTTTTGIPDNERATTISTLGEVAREPTAWEFAEEFRAPGHVHLLKGARGGVTERQGHTELSLCLANAANREPATVVCEMLDDETGEALPVEDAQAYAREHGLVFVEGSELRRELF